MFSACNTRSEPKTCEDTWGKQWKQEYATGEIRIDFVKGTKTDEALKVMERHGLEPTWSFGTDTLSYTASVSNGEEINSMCSLESEKSVASVEPYKA